MSSLPYENTGRLKSTLSPFFTVVVAFFEDHSLCHICQLSPIESEICLLFKENVVIVGTRSALVNIRLIHRLSCQWAQFHLEVDFGVRDFEIWSRRMGQSDGPAPVDSMAEAQTSPERWRMRVCCGCFRSWHSSTMWTEWHASTCRSLLSLAISIMSRGETS